MSGARPKKEVAPKITSTIMTISKSTPFLIRKHHLDDSQMRSVLHYEERVCRPGLPRTYSYQAQLRTCVSSQLKQQQPSLPIHLPPNPKPPKNVSKAEPEKRCEYYESSKVTKQVQTEANLKNTRSQTELQGTKRIKESRLTTSRHETYHERTPAKKEKERVQGEYGLREVIAARRTLEKEASKLRKLYKMKVEHDIQQKEDDRVAKLEEQIHQLRIKNLELEKQRWSQQLQTKRNNLDSESEKEKMRGRQTRANLERAQLIVKKPKYERKPPRENTDSSFSSFQLY